MRKTTAIVLAITMALTLAMTGAATAGSGTGVYEWRISFSDTDAGVQTAADFPGGTVQSIYLWFQGCNTGVPPGGMSAADFGIAVLGGWQFLSFNVNGPGGWLNAGSGQNLLLAVGGCPLASQVAGTISIFVTAPGAARLGRSVNDIAVTVDCASPLPSAWSWPDQVLFMGAKSNGFGGNVQAWGNGCTVDPVDATTWGTMKALYR
jgi:hypothetical protein